jgi:hypothetical protein
MSAIAKIKNQIGSMIESRVRRVFQMAGRHNSPADDPFLKLQWMIKYESGLIKDMILRGEGPQSDWDRMGYSVYSQFDEDGLIQYLISVVKPERDHFVEIGIEDYRQSNTRYLLEKSNWTGTIMDCADGATTFLDTLDLRTSHTVDFVKTLVTVENINQLLAKEGEIGIFSLDIDSMDYYVFEKLEARPNIIILEYMATYGPDADVSVPFGDNFDRFKHHFSGLCVGASLTAMTRLARAKGYTLVGCSDGHNAFYVRNDCLNGLPEKTPAEAISRCRYRDSRGLNFEFTYVSSIEERRKVMRDAVVFDFAVGRERTVADVYGI